MPSASEGEGRVVMTDFVRLLKGGDDAKKDGAAIVPGQPEKSHLVAQITPMKGVAEIPPKKAPLHESEVALIKRWIAEGAKDDTPENAKQRFDAEHPPIYSRPPVIVPLDFSPDGSLLAVAGFHEEELLSDWQLLEQGRKPSQIAPLQKTNAMNHPIYRITSVECVLPYALRLRFNDGLTRTIDLEPILEGELYGPLRDPDIFAQVALDPEIHTVVWPCGADFDPATLHDWPEHEAAFRAAAERWKHSAASV